MNLWPLEPLHFVLLVLRNNVGFIKEEGGEGARGKRKEKRGEESREKEQIGKEMGENYLPFHLKDICHC